MKRTVESTETKCHKINMQIYSSLSNFLFYFQRIVLFFFFLFDALYYVDSSNHLLFTFYQHSPRPNVRRDIPHSPCRGQRIDHISMYA